MSSSSTTIGICCEVWASASLNTVAVSAEDLKDLEILLVLLGYGKTEMASASAFAAASAATVSRKGSLQPILTSSKFWLQLHEQASRAAESPAKRDLKLAFAALAGLLPSSLSSVPLSEGEVAEKHRCVARVWDHDDLKDSDVAKLKTKMMDLGCAVATELADTPGLALAGLLGEAVLKVARLV